MATDPLVVVWLGAAFTGVIKPTLAMGATNKAFGAFCHVHLAVRMGKYAPPVSSADFLEPRNVERVSDVVVEDPDEGDPEDVRAPNIDEDPEEDAEVDPDTGCSDSGTLVKRVSK